MDWCQVRVRYVVVGEAVGEQLAGVGLLGRGILIPPAGDRAELTPNMRLLLVLQKGPSEGS